MIKTSLDWGLIETDLLHKSQGLAHGQEVRKMIRNIQYEVSLLSKAEVLARRGKKLMAEELLDQINEDIQTVQEFLLVAALIG